MRKEFESTRSRFGTKVLTDGGGMSTKWTKWWSSYQLTGGALSYSLIAKLDRSILCYYEFLIPTMHIGVDSKVESESVTNNNKSRNLFYLSFFLVYLQNLNANLITSIFGISFSSFIASLIASYAIGLPFHPYEPAGLRRTCWAPGSWHGTPP